MNSIASAIVNLLCLGTSENTNCVVSKAERKKFFLYLIDIVKNVDEKMLKFSIHTDQKRICTFIFFDENVRQEVRKLLADRAINVRDVVKLEFDIFEAVEEDISVKDVKALAIKQFTTFIRNSIHYSVDILCLRKSQVTPRKNDDDPTNFRDVIRYKTEQSKATFTSINAEMEILACSDVLIQDKIPHSSKHTQYCKFLELRTNDYKTTKTRDGFRIFYRYSKNLANIRCVIESTLYEFLLNKSDIFTTSSTFNSSSLKNNLSLLLSRKIKQIKFDVVDKNTVNVEIEFQPVSELFQLRIVDLDTKPLLHLPLYLFSITARLKIIDGELYGSSGFIYIFLSPNMSLWYQINNTSFSVLFRSADLQQCADFNFITNSISQIVYGVIFDCIKRMVKKQNLPINCIISGAKRMPNAIRNFFE